VSSLWLLAGCITVPEFRALQRDVETLQGGGGAPGGDVRQRLADLGQEVTVLREEVARLQGQLEEAHYLARQALQEAEAARRAPAAAPRSGNRQGPSAGMPLIPPPPGAVAGEREPVAATRPPDAGGSAGVSPQEVRDYEEAFRLYRAGDYAGAASRFQSFLQTWPGSDYADNAMFWMGECHYKLGDHVLAAVTFEKVSKDYPEGNKVPDALYRQGIALLAIGEQKGEQAAYGSAAREIFQRIVDDYPRSDRVDEARRQLAKLGT
jgi:tol-pal system protein YbgF